ncbi:MAG TPA: phosphoglycerate kinase [Candidatus Latescibacteria bacterium]|nr:phosphoglycerate kinase [Candidatus Latescibacterota bacterium]
MAKLTVRDLELKGKRVLMRVDFNVPLEDGKVRDDTRIRASLPTIRYVTEHGGKLILMSHLGRPKGKVVPELSLKPVAGRLSELLGRPVGMAPDCMGPEVEKMVGELKEGDVLLLENMRFHPEEEKNDPEFSRKLASLGDVYVNDAFGTAHRAHASTEGVTHYFSQCAAGFLMEKELEFLGMVLENPKRPFVAILGGAKVSDKIGVIRNLLGQVDALLIGGGMAYTFFKAKGWEVGKSLLEEDKVSLASELMEEAGRKGVRLVLPVDNVVTDFLDFEGRKYGRTQVVPSDRIPSDWEGVDIGPETAREFREEVLGAKTVFWNGPMGVFEIDEFAKGTEEVAKALAEATEKGAVTVVGGGDSAAAVRKAGLEERVSHASTGGGASLEFVEGRELPGVKSLTDKEDTSEEV